MALSAYQRQLVRDPVTGSLIPRFELELANRHRALDAAALAAKRSYEDQVRLSGYAQIAARFGADLSSVVRGFEIYNSQFASESRKAFPNYSRIAKPEQYFTYTAGNTPPGAVSPGWPGRDTTNYATRISTSKPDLADPYRPTPIATAAPPAVRSLPWSITESLHKPNGKLVLGTSAGIVSVNNPNFNATPVYYRIQAGVGSLSETGLASDNFRGGSVNFRLSPADIAHLPNNTSVPLTLSFFQKDPSGREVNTISKTYSYVVSRPLSASLSLNRSDRLYKEGDVLSFSVDARNISQPFNQIHWKLSGSGLSSNTFTSSSDSTRYGVSDGKQYNTSLFGAARLVPSVGNNPSGFGKLDYPISPMLFSRNSTVDGNRRLTLSIYSDSSHTNLLDSAEFTLSDGPAPVAPPTDPISGGRLVTATFAKDFLTGTSSADRFLFPSLSSSRLDSIDRIIGFQPGVDILDAPGAFSFADIKKLPSLLASPGFDVPSAATVSSQLNAINFPAGGAAMFSVVGSASVAPRTFLALNDNVAGFNALTDFIVEISDWSGNITNLSIV